MNKKLPIYILVIYFVLVMLILILQLAGREKSDYVAVGFNDRLDGAVVVYEKSPIMLKKQKQTFINEDNTSETPILIDGVNYLPLSFYKNGFDAVVSFNNNKGQLTIKYDNKALVAEKGSVKASLSTAERDKKTELKYPPLVLDGECFVAVRDFAEVFGLELFYDDGLIILSNMKNIFDKDTEGELIEEIKDLVYNLPLASPEIVKSLYEPDKEPLKEKYLKTEDDSELYILCRDEYVYFVQGERVVKADEMPYGDYKELNYVLLPTGFSAERIKVLGDYVCVMGKKNSLCAFCLLDMNGDYGIMRKFVCMDGDAAGAVISDGYLYLGALCDPIAAAGESHDSVNGYVGISYDNVRYFSENNGNLLLSVVGCPLDNLTGENIYSGFFGVNRELTFCGSGIYAGQSDKNKIYGDSEKTYSNIYKLGFDEGFALFENKIRLEGSVRLASKSKPLFIAQNDNGKIDFYLLDSLLDISAVNKDIEAPCADLAEGEERIFLSDDEGKSISVMSALDGEYLGSFTLNDEKLYLYNDERIIGFSQETPEGESADTAEETALPAVRMTLYDISKPDKPEAVSEEIIENADPSMFDALEPELGEGIVIIPVKVWEADGTLYEGSYGYIESSFYGLKFQDRR